jgi:hypothetical protein
MATDDHYIELSDMLESYPPAMTPGFQTLITAKKEFSELTADPYERLPPGRGQYFKHQIFAHRFLRAYDDFISLSEPGVGKSCQILGFAEYAHKELEKAKIDPSTANEKVAHFRRVIVLVKGPTQKNEFRNQLVCKCSDGRYETSTVKKSKTETVQKTNITLEIKKAGYAVSTYTSFAHRVAKQYPTDADNARLADDFSDTIFWIDEAHNLLSDPTAPANLKKEKQQTFLTIWRVLHLALRSKRIISTATPMINDENEMGGLLNLILPLDGMIPTSYNYRTAPPNDIRVLFPGLALANPPIDHRTASPEQMSPYFRGQIPQDYNFKTATLEDLEPFLRGRIGFIRAANTSGVPIEQGIPQREEYEVNGVRYQSQLVIYATSMSQHQSDGYLISKQIIRGRDDLFGAERQASNFVFPDGYWGNGITDEERNARQEARRAKATIKATIKAAGTNVGQMGEILAPQIEALPVGGRLPIGPRTEQPIVETVVDEQLGTQQVGFERRAFRRYVTMKGDAYSPTYELLPWLQDLAYIRNLSCKYAEIVRLVMTDPGNCFVYSEFVEGSGAIVLALCLEGMGFERYNESNSMFLGIGGETVKPVCPNIQYDTEIETNPEKIAIKSGERAAERMGANRRVRPDILSRQQGAPMRYCLLTRETSDSKFQSMMEAMNSYENRYGDYIKVLISSRVGRDAINVNNVLQVHLVGSEWNQSAIYQALSRSIRATSHDDLVNEERERIRNEGGDPLTAFINVKIYKHAAVALDDAGSSIDLQMYRMAEYKDRAIKRIMRIAKQCSIGCQVHYNRNVRAGDVDGTPVCDYGICNYQCVDPSPEEEDYSTYDVLYSSEVVSDAVNKIVNIYRQRNVLTLDDIVILLPDFRHKYLIMALEKLISNKTPLIDRFGYTSYLREDHGSFYLDRSYPVGTLPSYAMSYYTQGVIGIKQETLANIVFRLEIGEHQEVLAELEIMDPKDPQFNARLDAISIEGQVGILEEVIIRSLRGIRNEFTDAIITKFQRMIFPIREPITELNKVYQQLAQRLPKRGRKPNPETKRRIKKINPITIDETKIVRDETSEIVYLHTLYSQVINQTGYATTARFNKGEGRTRLLKPSEIDDGWRDLNEIELPVYNAFIQIEIATRNRPFEEQGIYGFILPDKKFRIRDRLTEDIGASEDARKIKRGKVCDTWYRPDLIDILFQLEISAPGGMFPDFKEENKLQLIQMLLQRRINKTPEELATWPLEQLVWYFKWYSATAVKRVTICNLIQRRMEETGRLLE